MLPFRIYICALAALQRQGEPQEPRVLLHSTGSLQLEVIADLNLGLLKEVICDLKTQAHATQNGSQVPASSEEILGRVHRKEVDSRVTVSLVLRVPWTVRARLVVPAPRRLRKATKIFLEGIPPLNTEKSKGSVGSPAHHPQVSGHAKSSLWEEEQLVFIAPAISSLPQLCWSRGLGAKPHSSITSPGRFSPTRTVFISFSPLFQPVPGGRAAVPCPRRCCQAAAGGVRDPAVG